jgi:hypothetical protein
MDAASKDELDALLAASPRDSERGRVRMEPEVLEAVREALSWLDRALLGQEEDPVGAGQDVDCARDILLDLLMGQYSRRRPVPAVDRILAAEAALDRAVEAEVAPDPVPEAPESPERAVTPVIPAPKAEPRPPAWRRKLDAPARRSAPLPVEQAREADFMQVLSRLDIKARMEYGGRKARARCPFHEDTSPSLHVDVERGLWYCFPCQLGGDVVDFVRRVKHVDFADAVRFIVEET